MSSTPWQLDSTDGNPILGNTHLPTSAPRGNVLIIHGFLGYKDYGMFPHLAESLDHLGFLAHRFNLSRSGMTNIHETFERPDLFEQDTWDSQVSDVNRVISAIENRELPGEKLPIVLVGHSRGGVTALLCAGRRTRDKIEPLPSAVVTIAAPSSCCSMDQAARDSMKELGHLAIRSNRTGQSLHLGAGWLEAQERSPENHDLLALAAQVQCPTLIAHGSDDPTVSPECATVLESAMPDGRKCLIEGADHVFNTPNPMLTDTAQSPQLSMLVGSIAGFLDTVFPTE